ncbi:MAG TPA: HAD-IIIA family hydrolase, partial [Pirellulales bacterium]|nr:HAD-IIIA family hydrolase [Pirellulales bacterium]
YRAGFALVVVSNQSGVARGYFPESSLQPIRRCLEDKMAECGAPIAGFYYCPHHPSGAVARFAVKCDCRKPRPGMLLTAAAELNVDLERSWLIGDILDDIEAGCSAGCRTVLIDNGHETQWEVGAGRLPEFIASDVGAASDYILSRHAHSSARRLAALHSWKSAARGKARRTSRAMRAGILPGLFAFPSCFNPRQWLGGIGGSR